MSSPKGCQVNLRSHPLNEEISSMLGESSDSETSGGLRLAIQGERLLLQDIG